MEPTLATSSASRSQLYSVPTAPAEVPIITTCTPDMVSNNNYNKLLTSSATSSQVLATRSSITALMMLFPATQSNPGSSL